MKYILFLPIVFLVSSCLSKQPEAQKTSGPSSTVAVQHPEFSADSAYSYIERQCEMGPRVPNSEPQKRCAEYLTKQLQRFGFSVQKQEFSSQSYDGQQWNGINIIGQWHSEISRRVVLFSHWDSRPFCDQDEAKYWKTPVSGANDGASGVGVLLEVARQLQKSGDSIGVDIAFLDLEDGGLPAFEDRYTSDTWCLGSQYLAEHPYYENKPCMGILLDMVGASNPFFGFDEVSSFYAQTYLTECWTVASSLGYSNYFVPEFSGSIVDDHYYINSKGYIPTIDIIDYKSSRGFPAVWHTTRDTPENIDKKTLKMVGEVVLAYLRK